MEFTAGEQRAMRRALDLACTPGVPLGPNPRVGCVLLDAQGVEIAEGYHRGAGSPHAEAAALVEAGADARGATAVVTLEPCNHTGRTGPCAEAMVEAGVLRVVFAQPDPNPVAAGGEATLRAAGVEVAFGLMEREARAVNRAWTFGMEHHRPFVTWKFAVTLDGRSAAADGTSRWVTSKAARVDAHRLRAQCDVMLVGTGTVESDDPELTVRDEYDDPLAHQPLRAVMGLRDLDGRRRVFNERADTIRLELAIRWRRWTACTPSTGSTCSSRADLDWQAPSCAPAWSTRWSPTWHPRCWARAPARWVTWASPRSTTHFACGSPTSRLSGRGPRPPCV